MLKNLKKKQIFLMFKEEAQFLKKQKEERKKYFEDLEWEMEVNPNFSWDEFHKKYI